jgi:hypothetical protein
MKRDDRAAHCDGRASTKWPQMAITFVNEVEDLKKAFELSPLPRQTIP